jgi:MFS family permease
MGWRWLYWIQLILSGVVWILITFTVPETYAPTILARRAKKMRKDTGEADHVTEQDIDPRPLGQRMRIFLIRPLQLLFQELIVFLISLYMSVLYGLLYMFFVAFPIIYQEGKGFSAGSTGLMLLVPQPPFLYRIKADPSTQHPRCHRCPMLRRLRSPGKPPLHDDGA